MKTVDVFNSIVKAQNSKKVKGIFSVCTYNELAIRASMRKALEDNTELLVETTSNQVNQYGGYTGMRPVDFKNYLDGLADKEDFPKEKLIYGADHLGPYPFRNETSGSAMNKAGEMIKAYIAAGATKIHLDTSMRVADDEGREYGLNPELVAERAADLCVTGEEEFEKIYGNSDNVDKPVYVIGTDVPQPGGSDIVEQGRRVTKPEKFKETVELTRAAFEKRNLQSAWERVVAVVVDPGVEHGDHTIIEYDRNMAKRLVDFVKTNYSGFLLEGHTTDFQTPQGLKKMVEDRIGILKVGPSLTFMGRSTIYLLEEIEKELYKYTDRQLSDYQQVLDKVMLENPKHWENYYPQEGGEFARKYSFFDRARYYLVDERVRHAYDILVKNLTEKEISLSVLYHYLPNQYMKVRKRELAKEPEAIILGRIMDVLIDYSAAVQTDIFLEDV